ncbi:VWA domain-containing protein [Alisedimentitalea sp. MJ-SS2]|uniref:vWA domain-containing protein n=1 Tax=Aliisedimentitalea sp. MJ-SS2 TaxID=3049795 RepID=UPI00290A150E|nr:VWA domain-containing protein [Alisedimentitalea sp. MJ-SS2]MDU8929670.1 VWA domain-containing protein [Alisedimentitalea sp. MJ-SS2]
MRFIFLFLLFLAPLTVQAQERSRAILVMDGSGSMWGQIEGEAKISIAQGVVRDLLETLPTDMELGLTIYGHRRKGDCTDIETVVMPGAGTKSGIADAVSRIKPKGKTPMTDAVRQAALALRYTEEKATVILVSDGIETCDPDPCAAARALEEAGVDFTAHVVGFDVTDTEALRQMQCLAEETGGTFLSASNAAELAEAMTAVVEATPVPEPEPVSVDITFVATDGKNGPVIGDALVWDLTQGDQSVGDTMNVDRFTVSLTPGEYQIEVMRPSDEATAEAIFGVGQVTKKVTVVLPEFRPAATIEAMASAAAGSHIPVRWSGPNAKNDFIAVSKLNTKGYETYSYTKEGSPLDLQMPAEPGEYELRYMLNKGSKILATRSITVTEVVATVVPAETMPAGGRVQVRWTGPDYRNDFIAISEVGEKGYETYAYTKHGSPLEIQLPADPGDYELRYVMNQTNRVLASVPISIEAVAASVTPPAEMPAGGTVKVTWEGPDNKNDYIAIFPRGEDKYAAYTYTNRGNPVDLRLPAKPGDYDLGYVQNQGNTVLVRVPVSVSAVTASVTPPAELPAGGTVKVIWEGPDDKNDYIAIFPRGEAKYAAYTYTNRGNPVDLRLPAKPGDYDLGYVQNQGNTVLVRVPVSVSAVTASVTPPAELPAGGTVKVTWEGPDDKNDYIAIFPRGEAKYAAYTYTNRGNPVDLRLPAKPGDYDLGYVQNQGNTVLVRVPVSVSAVTASVTPPAELPAGGTVKVTWEGPDDKNDYIAIFPRGGDKQVGYTYTKHGSPADLRLPDEPGAYDLGYVQSVGKTVLVRVPIDVK